MFENSVQVAGIRSLDEALMLENLGVHFIGFPLRLGFHTPDISEKEAKSIISQLNDPSRAVLITYVTTADEAAKFAAELGVGIVQLHGDISPYEVRLLKQRVPELKIIKSLIVRPDYENDSRPLLEIAEPYDQWVDAFITDTFDPKTGATGCTGLTHNWSISRAMVGFLSRPLILAGGLTSTNVHDAITAVGPAGVDAHSGVEDSTGAKSPELVRAFMEAAQNVFAKRAG